MEDVFSYLEDQALAGGSTAWSMTRRRMMDAPAEDQLVVVSEDGGPPPEIDEVAGIGDTAEEEPGVLVTVRAEAWDGDASYGKAKEILDALHGQRNLVMGSRTYLRIIAMTPEPVFSGYDDQNRPRHTVALRALADR